MNIEPCNCSNHPAITLHVQAPLLAFLMLLGWALLILSLYKSNQTSGREQLKWKPSPSFHVQRIAANSYTAGETVSDCRM